MTLADFKDALMALCPISNKYESADNTNKDESNTVTLPQAYFQVSRFPVKHLDSNVDIALKH